MSAAEGETSNKQRTIKHAKREREGGGEGGGREGGREEREREKRERERALRTW